MVYALVGFVGLVLFYIGIKETFKDYREESRWWGSTALMLGAALAVYSVIFALANSVTAQEDATQRRSQEVRSAMVSQLVQGAGWTKAYEVEHQTLLTHEGVAILIEDSRKEETPKVTLSATLQPGIPAEKKP